MDLIAKQGYRLPFGVPKKGYPWGSNSFVLTNALMIGLAYDFTKDGKYLNGVAMGMDYVLGRNADRPELRDGVGRSPAREPVPPLLVPPGEPEVPAAAAGRAVGRPELGLRRSLHAVGRASAGCAPQKCFLDNGEAWSANEVTINWNAPLFWVAAYLDEKEAPQDAAAKGKKK